MVAASAVAAAAAVTVAGEKIFTEEREREREVVQLSREMVLWLLEVGMMVRS